MVFGLGAKRPFPGGPGPDEMLFVFKKFAD
jgi:hypothetical protein